MTWQTSLSRVIRRLQSQISGSWSRHTILLFASGRSSLVSHASQAGPAWCGALCHGVPANSSWWCVELMCVPCCMYFRTLLLPVVNLGSFRVRADLLPSSLTKSRPVGHGMQQRLYRPIYCLEHLKPRNLDFLLASTSSAPYDAQRPGPYSSETSPSLPSEAPWPLTFSLEGASSLNETLPANPQVELSCDLPTNTLAHMSILQS